MLSWPQIFFYHCSLTIFSSALWLFFLICSHHEYIFPPFTPQLHFQTTGSLFKLQCFASCEHLSASDLTFLLPSWHADILFQIWYCDHFSASVFKIPWSKPMGPCCFVSHITSHKKLWEMTPSSLINFSSCIASGNTRWNITWWF